MKAPSWGANNKLCVLLLVGFVLQFAVGLSRIIEKYQEALPYASALRLPSSAELPGFFVVILFNALILGLALGLSPVKPSRVGAITSLSYGFLFHTGLMGLMHYVCVFSTRHFYPWLSWLYVVSGYVIALLFARGEFVGNFNILTKRAKNAMASVAGKKNGVPASALCLFLLAMIPFLFLPYHHCDTKEFYAKRAFLIQETGDYRSFGIEPASEYPPLYSIVLWMGMGDTVFQGRIIPFVWLLCFMVIFYNRLRSRGIPNAKWILAFFAMTGSVWTGMISYYADVPLMIFLCSAFFLLEDQVFGGREFLPDTRAVWACAVLLSSCVLLRPDGVIALLTVLVCTMLFWKRGAMRDVFSASAVPLVFQLSWSLRPQAFRGIPHYFHEASEAALLGWGAGLHWKTVWNFLYAAQGLILSHYGFGVFFYFLFAACLFALRRKNIEERLKYYVCMSIAGFLVVCASYLVLGLFLNPTHDYKLFIRVSMGRSLLHFYPIMLLFVAGVLAKAGSWAGKSSADKQVDFIRAT